MNVQLLQRISTAYTHLSFQLGRLLMDLNLLHGLDHFFVARFQRDIMVNYHPRQAIFRNLHEEGFATMGHET